ncbi:MAG: DUF1799 domain-containing protein [Rhodoferax sp.]|nr:DUF1799 domain-containing protein [Rhodoferax sp.]MDP3652417.1 DUF1799 domain-containing protein [Rhodoferax sp.]
MEIARHATQLQAEAGNTPEDADHEQKAAQCFGLDLSEEPEGQQAEDVVCEIWPEHWDAYLLYMACRDQVEVSLGGMGGVHYAPVKACNVNQELTWLGLPRKVRAATVGLFRVIERESLQVINERANRPR